MSSVSSVAFILFCFVFLCSSVVLLAAGGFLAPALSWGLFSIIGVAFVGVSKGTMSVECLDFLTASLVPPTSSSAVFFFFFLLPPSSFLDLRTLSACCFLCFFRASLSVFSLALISPIASSMKFMPFFDTPAPITLCISSWSPGGSVEIDCVNGSRWNLCLLQSMDKMRSSTPSRTETFSLSSEPMAAKVIGFNGFGIQCLPMR